ncbi:hypothetical protein [Rhizobium sp. GCM10022189]|uniref:hypothetical protein n=1 Tax=Rhizobium sp. GCM10022189 TaxID=3252654 RepID=UPI00360B9AA9
MGITPASLSAVALTITITRIVSSPLLCGGISARLSSIHPIPAKPLRTFAGIALSFTQFRTQNRCALLLELLVPSRNSARKTAAHFCWNCSFPHAIPHAKPLRTFAGIAYETDGQSPGRHFLSRFFEDKWLCFLTTDEAAERTGQRRKSRAPGPALRIVDRYDGQARPRLRRWPRPISFARRERASA